MLVHQGVGSPWSPRLRVLSDFQVEELHTATLEILERVGVKVLVPEAVELLHGAGAFVGMDNWVRIPAHLVEAAIRSAPSRVVLWNRDGERMLFLENRRAYFGTVADCTEYLDPRTGEKRPCTLADTADMCRLTDSLPNFAFIHQAGIAADVDPALADRAVFHQMVTHTRKTLLFGCKDALALQDILDMAAVVAGSRELLRQKPFVCQFSEPISPLSHSRDPAEKLLLCAERGIPIVYIPMPEAGGTAPASMAAVLAQGNAECLSGLVIHQLKRPGAPFIYGGIPGMMDMSSTVVSYGAPEMNLMVAATTDMAHHYHLPMFGTAGCTDAKHIDAQAAVEAALSCLVSELSGANLIHDCCYMDHASLISPEYAVLINEILDWVHHFSGGIPVSQDTLALDVIAESKSKGEYVTTEHTLKNYRNFWYPQLFDRSQVADNLPDLNHRLRQRAVKVLDSHQVQPLPDDVVKELNRWEVKWRKA